VRLVFQKNQGVSGVLLQSFNGTTLTEPTDDDQRIVDQLYHGSPTLDCWGLLMEQQQKWEGQEELKELEEQGVPEWH
jgi:hypothetical protein